MNNNVYEQISGSSLNVYIWGAGSMAREVYYRLQEHGIYVKGFVVNVKVKPADEVTFLPIEDIEEIEKSGVDIDIVCGHGHFEKISDMYAYECVRKVYVIPNPYVQYQGPGESWVNEHKDEILSALDGLDEISRECVDSYYEVQNTGDVSCLLNRNLYVEDIFNYDKLEIGYDEVYVDIGAYTGDTVQMFKKHCNSRYAKIVAIEPNKRAYRSLCEDTACDDRIVTYNCAFGKINGKTRIDTTAMQSSHVSESGDTEVEVCRYDDLLLDESVTIMKIFVPFMALDILEGARKSIERYKPRLIVNVGADDGTHILDVIKWMGQLHAGYTISVRYDFPMPTRLCVFATK